MLPICRILHYLFPQHCSQRIKVPVAGPGKCGRPRRSRGRAAVVRRIFAEFIAGRGRDAIAENLTRDGIACPSAPGRNSHRCGVAWSKSAVRVILTNPRYTGRQVWSRQRKDEVLIDVADVALGHTTKMRWNEAGQWIYSEQVTHPAIIDEQTFARAQEVLVGRRH